MVKNINYDRIFENMSTFSNRIRNTFIFLLLLCIYSSMQVISVTDNMIFLEKTIYMPLLNIEFPLVPFFIIMPFYIFALSMYLLYLISKYNIFLGKINSYKHKDLIRHGYFSFYDNLENKGIIVKLAVYVLSLLSILIFWLRFADYQNLLISTIHFLLIVFIIYIIIKDKNFKKYKFISYISLIFIFVYHLIIGAFSNGNLFWINFITEYTSSELFLPRLTIKSEIVRNNVSKETLELIKEVKQGNEALITYQPIIYKTNRNFNQADFSGSIFVNIDFTNSNFVGANFNNCILIGSKFINSIMDYSSFGNSILVKDNFFQAKLNGANFSRVRIKNINCFDTEFNGAQFYGVNIINSSFNGSSFIGASFEFSKIIKANFKDASFIGAKLIKTNMLGAILDNSDFRGTLLTSVILAGSRIYNTKFVGSILVRVNLLSSRPYDYETFSSRFGKHTVLKYLSREKLKKEDVFKLIKEIKKYTSYGIYLNEIKKSLNQAIGKNSFEWINLNNYNIKTGILTHRIEGELIKFPLP